MTRQLARLEAGATSSACLRVALVGRSKEVMTGRAPERCDDGNAGSVADSLRTDFDALIGIFDRQLSRLSVSDGELRLHISEARKAAERGRKLSERLTELLRKTA